MARIARKILIHREDRPVAAQGDRADEEINSGAAHARGSAMIACESRFFIILNAQPGVLKGSKVLPQALVLTSVANSRQHLLPHGTDHLGAAFADQLPQFVPDKFFFRAEAPGAPAQSQRPHGGIHQDRHERRRSAL
jgi:hypothetical protein